MPKKDPATCTHISDRDGFITMRISWFATQTDEDAYCSSYAIDGTCTQCGKVFNFKDLTDFQAANPSVEWPYDPPRPKHDPVEWITEQLAIATLRPYRAGVALGLLPELSLEELTQVIEQAQQLRFKSAVKTDG